MKPLVIRADAGPEIGTGHVMRCLALAEAWRDTGGDVFFVSTSETSALETRLKKENIQIIYISQDAGTREDADETVRIAHEQGAEWIVADGYHFGAEYQKAIKNSGLWLLFIDDYGHADHYYADIVLNQNVYADMSIYHNYEPSVRFLLGTKYVLLRKEFLTGNRPPHNISRIARKILVTLGGSDPDNVTLNIINAVKTIDPGDTEVTVVIGGKNPHVDLIYQSVKDLPNITLIQNTGDMPGLMAWADIAISAGGSTCWELLFMGVPSIVISIADNQQPIVRELELLKIARSISDDVIKNPKELAKTIADFMHSPALRREFSERMSHYIDGNGTARILREMSAPRITLRNVEQADCKTIWSWINDPLVRSVSFNSQPISLECHKQWFSSAINNPDLVYYIALNKDSKPIGQARFQIESEEAVISILVDSENRGRSVGSTLIRDATERFFRENTIDMVKACIKTGNEASRKAFVKAGYIEQGLYDYNGTSAYLLVKRRGIR